MWLDDIDIGGPGIVQPAKGPLGSAVRHTRHELFLSQERLAKIAGVSQAAVSRLELGMPNWPLFCRLVDAMGGHPIVSVERLKTAREVMAAHMAGENPYPTSRPNEAAQVETYDEAVGDWL